MSISADSEKDFFEPLIISESWSLGEDVGQFDAEFSD